MKPCAWTHLIANMRGLIYSYVYNSMKSLFWNQRALQGDPQTDINHDESNRFVSGKLCLFSTFLTLYLDFFPKRPQILQFLAHFTTFHWPFSTFIGIKCSLLLYHLILWIYYIVILRIAALRYSLTCLQILFCWSVENLRILLNFKQ